ncbi:unnamed protein product [Cuscuta epithymum]|uniref:Shugoshin C-terminal domain-containing protein n=1 Tax=Cuscuta epithymum TaxID=186058 RepID=A0AAV0DGQ3_9ASTE|nr:unnamed protein product [Cuscuta epithymum]CAH9138074.1 unnamed protein product [Cuscuta epithymum]
MTSEVVAKQSSFGGVVRKRLSDITNSTLPPKFLMDKGKDVSPEEYINHLVKENMALLKLFEDKNKVIELSGIEIQKLRVSLQKMQLQNQSLAQSNSQMTAEVTLLKEKLNLIRHELGCKIVLLKAKDLESKEQENIKGRKNESQDGKAAAALPIAESSRPRRGGGQFRATRSRSMTPMSHSTASQQAPKEEIAEKRRRIRRQSAFYPKQQQEEEEKEENLLEDTIATESLHDPTITPPLPSDHQRPTRKSICGRPLRKAAEKVQSYKETPLNIKLRRPD